MMILNPWMLILHVLANSLTHGSCELNGMAIHFIHGRVIGRISANHDTRGLIRFIHGFANSEILRLLRGSG